MRRHVPQLDGLRTVAVLLVVLYHVGYLASGYVGVDIFFALSGYLITNILLSEYADGRWSLKAFYIRRARRLYPALVLMLVLTLPFGSLLAGNMGHYAADALIAGTYTSDLVSLHNMGSMGGFIHTWSLAVEEQFYLAWPLVLLFMLRRGLSRATMCAAIAVTGTAMLVALVAHGGQYLPVTRGGGLLVGCLLAVATRSRTLPKPRIVTPVAMTLLVAILVAAATTRNHHLVSASMGLAAVVGTALIGGLVGADTLVSRFLSLKPLVWVGQRSYGVYLWQFPIVYVLTNGHWGGHGSLRILIPTVVGSIALASLSARFIEGRFRVWSASGIAAGVPAAAAAGPA